MVDRHALDERDSGSHGRTRTQAEETSGPSPSCSLVLENGREA